MNTPPDSSDATERVPGRRQNDRKPSKLNKALQATFEASDDDTAKLCKLYLHDLSEDGMRVETPEQWDWNTRLFLRLPLGSFGQGLPRELTIECEIRWCKITVGGQAQYGLKFVSPSPRQADVIDRLLERLTHIGGRHHHRVDILMPVEMELKDNKMSIVVIQSLSHGGVRFRSKERLDVKQLIKYRLPIPNGKYVSGDLRMAWREETDDGKYEYGAAFRQISDIERALIDELIEYEARPN